MKILIVDDTVDNLLLIERLLHKHGHEVTSALNGLEALEELKKTSYDLIISDILMPTMDGFQLCRHCKTDEILQKIPFVFYTATYTAEEDEGLAKSLGADRFLLKPMKPDPFMAIIKGVLDDYQKGLLLPPEVLAKKDKDEVVYYKVYNERLINKLEKKLIDLEKANNSLMESEEFYRAITTTAHDGIIMIGDDHKITFWNKAAERIFGCSTQDAVGKSIHQFFLPDKNDANAEHLDSDKFLRTNKTVEVSGMSCNGTALSLEAVFSPIKIRGVSHFMCLIRDISDQKRALADLRKLSRAVEQSPSMVVITNISGDIEYVNPKFTQLTGYTLEEVVGKNPRILKSGEIAPEVYKHLWHTVISGNEWRGEFLNKKKNGEFWWEQASISPIKDATGVITHFLAVAEDITERRKYEKQLLRMSIHDPLTSLFNRKRFREELEHCTIQARRHGASGAVLFVDIDNFKYINDTHGHQFGDGLLIRLAILLREKMSETDILARFGGDEFAIILPNSDRDRAQSISQQILTWIQEHVFLEYRKINASIGIVMFPEHGLDAETLLACADMAMYKAKESGRNCSCFYSPNLKTRLESQLKWEKQIRHALENDRFQLYLQPINNIRLGVIAGYEALLRMLDENGRPIAPTEFLKVAERIGLIHEIDHWVALNAISLIKKHQLDRKGLFLEINLSGKAFTDSKLLPKIKRAINSASVNPSNIVFEITETAIIENLVDAQHFIATFKAMGCCFALDDFGNGYSSFGYLKHLAVDTLKIDGSFILDLPNNSVDQHLVKAMVEVARGLQKLTIAEFVESSETVNILREIGVDYAQGYHIGYPAPTSEIF